MDDATEYASRLFHDPDLDVVRSLVEDYEATAPEAQSNCFGISLREWKIASLQNWAISGRRREAWDALKRIAERTLDRGETAPPILADFAMEAFSGRWVAPGTGRGRPAADPNDTLRVYATVQALTSRGYTKTAAYAQVAKWRHLDPDTIRKTCQAFRKRSPHSA